MLPEHWLYTVPLRLNSLFRRRRLDQDLDEELRDHLEQKAQEYVEKGLNPEDAYFAALRDFGNVELAKQNCRDKRKTLWLPNLIEDLGFSLRILRKDYGFTVAAVLTLALGIGANTVIFSVINTVLLRPLPYDHPERLVSLTESSPDLPVMFISLANFADWRTMNTVFESMGGFRKEGVTLSNDGEPRHLVIGQVTAGLFPTLGVHPVLGNLLAAEQDKPGAQPVVLLSDNLWARDFGREDRVLGKRLTLDGVAYTVIGVVPTRHFPLPWRQMDAFTSLGRLESAIGGESHRSLHMGVSAYARLKPGITLEQARAEMLAIARRLEKQHPQTNVGQSVIVQPLLQKIVGDVSRPLRLLMGAVALVLLIACMNVANLLTSRAIVRRRETAIRSALGARPSRLAGQLLCESTLLALTGGTLGLLVAYGATRLLSQRAASILPRIEDISIDGSVLWFTFILALVTAIAFSVVPTLALYRTRPTEALWESGCGPSSSSWRIPLRSALATLELAMALVLLVAAGCTLKSLFHVLHADLGLQTDGVLTGVISWPAVPYKNEARLEAAVRQLTQKVVALPGVKAAGFESAQLVGGSEVSFHVEGEPQPRTDEEPYAEFSSVTPGALEALGVTLISGRFFRWSDQAQTAPVCIIDDAMSTRYWPGQSAIGKRLVTDAPRTPEGQPILRTVVGVVHRMRTNATDERRLVGIFIPYAQYQIVRRGRLIIRSSEDPTSLLLAVRREMHSLDPALSLYDIRSLADLVDENIAARRLEMILLSVFAGIALILAATGVYGVMTYLVNGRAREIGLRLALGAKPGDIMRLVLGLGMPVILLGAGVGVIASLLVNGTLGTLRLGVSGPDPWTIVYVAALLILVALLACYVPARAAMGMDPAASLRRES